MGHDFEFLKKLWAVGSEQPNLDPEEGPQGMATADRQNHGGLMALFYFYTDLLRCIQYRKPPWGIPGCDPDAHLSLVSI